MSRISFKEINRLAIPAIFAGVVEPLISITDMAVAGRLEVDTVEAIAAIGLVGAFLSTLIWIFAQTRSAVSAYVSQAYGADNINYIRPLVGQIFWMNFAISLFILGGSYFLSREIFGLYNASGLVLDYCESYYEIRAWGYPLTLLTFTIFGAFRGVQNTSWAMWISLIGGTLNIGLDYLFAFPMDMHVEGIAYASLVAQSVMFVLSVLILFTKTPFRLKLTTSLHPMMGKALLMIGNLIMRGISLNIALFMASRYATSYGEEEIDTQSILFQIWLFSAFFMDGYSTAGNAIGGKLLGAKDYKKLWRLSIDLTKSMLLVSVFLMCVYTVSYFEIGALFAPGQEGIIRLVNATFWIIIIMQPVNAIAFLFDGIFKGLGDAAFLRNLVFIATFVGFIPTLLILDHLGMELYAIWAAFFVWMLIRALIPVLRFRKKFRRAKDN